jgi:O-antigen/teichoic acid export membrane protein
MISGVNFLAGILLARYLGLSEFGVFTLAWLTVELLHSVQGSIVIAPLMSIGPKESDQDRPAYFGAVVVQQLIFAVLSMAIFVLALEVFDLIKPGLLTDELTWPLLAAAFASQMQNFVRRLLFTVRRGAAAFLSDMMRYGVQILVLLALLLSIEMNAGRALWVIAGSSAAAAILGSFFIDRIQWNSVVFKRALSRHLQFAKWLLCSECLRWSSAPLFHFTAGAILGPAVVGAIKATQNLVGVCHVIQLALENIVPVRAAQHYASTGFSAMVAYIKRVALLGGGAIAAIVTVGAVAPEFWLGLIYGPAYEGQGFLVQWWALIYAFGFFAMPLSYALRTLEETRLIFLAQLAAALFSVAAVYPLVSIFGITGVMFGMLIVISIRNVALYLGFNNRLASLRQAA